MANSWIFRRPFDYATRRAGAEKKFMLSLQQQQAGRTTKNTHAFPLGQFVAMGWRMNIPQ